MNSLLFAIFLALTPAKPVFDVNWSSIQLQVHSETYHIQSEKELFDVLRQIDQPTTIILKKNSKTFKSWIDFDQNTPDYVCSVVSHFVMSSFPEYQNNSHFPYELQRTYADALKEQYYGNQ